MIIIIIIYCLISLSRVIDKSSIQQKCRYEEMDSDFDKL